MTKPEAKPLRADNTSRLHVRRPSNARNAEHIHACHILFDKRKSLFQIISSLVCRGTQVAGVVAQRRDVFPATRNQLRGDALSSELRLDPKGCDPWGVVWPLIEVVFDDEDGADIAVVIMGDEG